VDLSGWCEVVGIIVGWNMKGSVGVIRMVHDKNTIDAWHFAGQYGVESIKRILKNSWGLCVMQVICK
jgi:hypothetical protein